MILLMTDRLRTSQWTVVVEKLSEPGSPMPPGMKEKILLELREMLRKA